jgi:hypothetical protein
MATSGMGQSSKRQNRPAFVLGYAYDDVPAAQVVEIIRKRTHGVQHGFWIPPGFKLQPLPLDRAGYEY